MQGLPQQDISQRAQVPSARLFLLENQGLALRPLHIIISARVLRSQGEE